MSVGGAFSGQAGENSSFKWGMFDQTVTAIEMVLADGTIEDSSKEGDENVLQHAAGAFGTLGVVTRLSITLIDAPKSIELTYHRTSSVEYASDKLTELMANDRIEYLHGIIYAPDKIVVMAGKPKQDLASGQRIQTLTRRADPWFYLHAGAQCDSYGEDKGAVAISIPLIDYLFR